MTDWTQYAVLVTATDSTSHGSGFVVEQGPTGARIVTCDHVVADLRGDLRVNGRAATVVFRGGDAGVDLAVLEVGAPLGVPTVRLGSAAALGRAVVAVGWRRADQGQTSEAIEGTIERHAQLTYPADGHAPQPGYRLAIGEGDDSIHGGYSGGPVIDVATGEVVAVLRMKAGATTVYATAIGALRSWRADLAAPRRAAATSRPGRDADVWTALLGTDDASIATQAAFALETRDDAADRALDAPGAATLASRWVRRYLIDRAPERVADRVVERILGTERDWDRGMDAATIAPTALPNRYRAPLVEVLEKPEWRRELCRIVLVALGRVGDHSTAYSIDAFLQRSRDDVHYRFFGVSALVTLFFAQPELARAKLVGNALRECAGRHHEPFQLDHRLELIRARSVHAEAFLRDWLDDDSAAVRGYAVQGLGRVAMQRSVRELIEHLDHERDAAVRRATMDALASIGTEPAVRHVFAHPEVSARASAIALEHLDPHRFRARYDEVLRDGAWRWAAVRALGVRDAALDRRRLDPLFDALAGAEPAARGQAALAIARRFGADELPALRRAHDEAAEPHERIFTALAICVAVPRDYPAIARGLHRDAHGFYRLEAWSQRDVLDVLRAVGHPEASALAESLALVSGHASGDLARTRAAVGLLGPAGQLDADV